MEQKIDFFDLMRINTDYEDFVDLIESLNVLKKDIESRRNDVIEAIEATIKRARGEIEDMGGCSICGCLKSHEDYEGNKVCGFCENVIEEASRDKSDLETYGYYEYENLNI